MLELIGLIIGLVIGLISPWTIPVQWSLYAACGLLAARNLYARLEGRELPPPPADTMCGALVQYLTTENKNFQPMGANMGILPPLPEDKRPRDKRLRYMAQAERAVASFQQWLDETAL